MKLVLPENIRPQKTTIATTKKAAQKLKVIAEQRHCTIADVVDALADYAEQVHAGKSE